MAIFGGMLTAGITMALGDMNNNAYIQTLKKSPAASQISNVNDANTLLNLNTAETKQKVLDGLDKNLHALPEAARSKAIAQVKTQQDEYSREIVEAFSTSLHRIFYVTSSLMFVAFLLSIALKERPLKTARPEDTPGEA
jgi:hypothetical protein